MRNEERNISRGHSFGEEKNGLDPFVKETFWFFILSERLTIETLPFITKSLWLRNFRGAIRFENRKYQSLIGNQKPSGWN